jgi:hypothetical protein
MLSAERSPLGRSAHPVSAGIAVIVTSFSIAICAAAPEFIWQGMRVALAEPRWEDLAAALLIGLNLAFFIEPAMARLRALIHRGDSHEPAPAHPLDVFSTASLGLAFALASVCLHDAMSAFVSGHGTMDNSRLRAAVSLIIAWAIVPFAVAIAWQSIGRRVLLALAATIAVASPFIAGWLFEWSARDVITTAIPSLFIFGIGYRREGRKPAPGPLARHAPIVALVAAIWLAGALLADVGIGLFHLKHLRLYTWSRFFIDLRFYVGWAAGLMFARFPALAARRG